MPGLHIYAIVVFCCFLFLRRYICACPFGVFFAVTAENVCFVMRQMHNHYFLVKRSFVNGILYEIFLSCDLLCAKWRPNTNIEDQVIAERI